MLRRPLKLEEVIQTLEGVCVLEPVEHWMNDEPVYVLYHNDHPRQTVSYERVKALAALYQLEKQGLRK